MWTPPPNVIAVGNALQGTILHSPGSMTSPESPRVQLEPGDGTKALAQWLQTRWGLTQAGTRRGSSMSSPAQRPDGTWRRRDLHEDGRAIDAMTGRAKTKGEEIADLVALFADRLGVQYVVFDGYEWSATRTGPAWERVQESADRAAWGREVDMHEDHVHIELTAAAARDGDRMRAAIAEIERAMAASGNVSQIRRSFAPTVRASEDGPSLAVLLVVIAIVAAIALAVRRWRRRLST